MRIIPVLVLAAVLAACGPNGSDDGRTHVVASFYPLAEAAQRVGGDAVTVSDLTKPGVEPHDLELTTRQLDDVLDADVVVLMGEGFQPAVEEAADHRDLPTVAVLDHLGATKDPHVWLDPQRMRRIVDVVADALGEAEPSRRAGIERRASRFDAELVELDARYRRGLASCQRTTIVTAHAAFGWLARRYGLEQQAVAGVSPEQEPDPRRLAALEDLVRREGVTTIFTEELVSPKVARALAREAGVRTAVLDPIETVTREGDDYVRVMDRNLAALRRALDCS